jgi:Spy/CpxP family protein refolding chaperone
LGDLHATTRSLYEQIEPLETQLRTQLDAASPDACAVGATVVQIDAVRDQIRGARQDFDAAFSAILTAEQLAKYEALKELVRANNEEEGD